MCALFLIFSEAAMENVLTISFFALLTALISLFLRESKLPVAALLLTLAAGIIIFLTLLPKISQVFSVLKDLSEQVNLNYSYLSVIFKLLGIAYITEFAAQLCRDAGEGALSMKIELGGKLGILLLSLPIVAQVLQTVLDLV